jgi:hypothetical protein
MAMVHTRVVRFATAALLVIGLSGAAVVPTAVPAGAISSWSVDTVPNVAIVLSSVSCVSSTFCKAVGGTSIESWNGTTWSVDSTPNPGPGALVSVSCATAASCMAVGSYTDGTGHPHSLIESWNGSAWSIIASPKKTAYTLLGVSCVSATACKAVGYQKEATAGRQTLIEKWNGIKWSVMTSPNVVGGTPIANELTGVACTSAKACMAVGDSTDGSVNGKQTLIESLKGKTWSILASPDPGTPSQFSAGNFLFGVSCAAATSCKAVGWFYNSEVPQTLIESWDGANWSLDASQNPGAYYSTLASVSCVSASFCKAVGVTYGGASLQTLVESWDGVAWSIDASPNVGTHDNRLSGASCGSTSSCKAVGYRVAAAATTLIESYG